MDPSLDLNPQLPDVPRSLSPSVQKSLTGDANLPPTDLPSQSHLLYATVPSSPTIAVSDPQFPFKAHDELLHLCAMDSIMPTANRRLENSGDPPTFSLTTQFMDGAPLLLKPSKPSLPSNPLGVWASPLKPGSSVLPEESLKQNPIPPKGNVSDFFSTTQWPSLSVGQPQARKIPPQSMAGLATTATTAPGSSTKANSEAIKASHTVTHQNHALEFPWAAKLHATRNLHRVTTPVFMEDGTPKVTIPSQILLQGIENQKEYVVGQFYRCAAPSGGQIHAVVSRIWGRRCRIYTRKLSESSYMFHIPDENTRNWVLSRGLWHVDDCLMFVSSWNPTATLILPEISTVPVWLTLKNIPNQLYSFKGIERIASGLGEPMLTNKPWLDPTLMGEAKILVEVKLDKPFYQKVALEDESGSISFVDVVYSWLPAKCTKCGQLGHKASRCLGLSPIQSKTTEENCSTSSSLPKVVFSSVDLGFEPPIEPAPIKDVPAFIASSASVEVRASNQPEKVVEIIESGQIEPVILETSPLQANIFAPIEAITSLPLTSDFATAETENVTFIESTSIQTAASEIDTSSTLPSNSSETQVAIISAIGNETSLVSESDVADIVIVEEEVEVPHGNNMYDSLGSQWAGSDSFPLQDVDMSASSQRNLRERPIKPPQHLQQSEWQTVQRGRGSKRSRGRGGRAP